METKIISIDISPESTETPTENAGVMWEHNATQLVFNIDKSYIGDYKYYLEYRSLIGTKVRTEYLILNTENNTITYDIPVTMSSLKGVECYFNIVLIDDDGNTIQVIKPHKFCLQFDYSPDTDNSLAKVNDFSVNALLEAIRLGTFKGDKGEKGDTGDKGDKGEKGDTGEVSLDYANSNFADAIKKTKSGNPVIIDNASPLVHTLEVKTNANETVFVRGKNLIPFTNMKYNNKYEAGNTYQISGVSFTINRDGSITVKGTATSSAVLPLFVCSQFKTGVHTVTLSGSPEGASVSKYCLRLEKENAVGAYGAEDYGTGKTVENVDLSGCSVSIVVISGTTIDATFYPMLEFGMQASEYSVPCGVNSASADENGVAKVSSVSETMSVFTESNSNIECEYNQKTSSAIKEVNENIHNEVNKLNYRLINTVTFNEDGQLATFNTDSEGNAIKNINLKKAFLLFTGSFTNTVSKQSLYLRCNGGSIYLMYKEFSVTADKLYGFWMDFEKVFSLPDRTIYKSNYPVNMLTNFVADTELAQGLAGNNVAVNSDLCVSKNADFNTIQFGCTTDSNLIKAGSKVYLFGI